MPPCPTPDKTGNYPSLRLANRALRKVRSQPVINGGPRPNRAYRCPCGQWHLTRLTSSEAQARRRRERSRQQQKQDWKREAIWASRLR